MKAKLVTLSFCVWLESCAAYNNNPVAAHAGAGYMVGSGQRAMMASPEGFNRHEAEAAKAKAFYGK